MGSIRHGQTQGVFAGGRAAAGRSRGACGQHGLCPGGYRAPAACHAADRPRPGGAVSGGQEHHRARRAPSAGRGPHQPGPPAGQKGAGPRPAPGHGLCPHRGTERPPAQGGAGAPALRHAGGYRLRGGGAAGLHGDAAGRGRAGVPPALGAVHPARYATGQRHAPGQPRQR